MSLLPAQAVRSLRASAEGHLLADADKVRPVRWVIDRRAGTLVFPLPHGFDSLSEAQLLVPEEHDPRLAALLSVTPTDTPPAAAEIRHEVYHGKAGGAWWATASIEALRYHGEPIDGDEISLADPLAGDEPALCRELNADTGRLAKLCQRHAGARVPEPVAIGVDPDGIDVRARFGIVRIEFPSTVDHPDAARDAIAQLHDGESS